MVEAAFYWHSAQYLWVYGTLRTGESNYQEYMVGRTRFIGKATCFGKLYTVNDRYPVLQLGGRDLVYGELFEPLSEQRKLLFHELDQLEGVHDEYYQGSVIELSDSSWAVYTVGQKMLHYCQPQYLIPGGDWCRYQENR
jgi:gamma-glutamylcyclotransferase (GGCT)/AIG2-like uncharacterized protein YtfP